MSTVWLCVLVVGAATVAIKAGGPVFAGGRGLPLGASRVVDLLAPALLAALVATHNLDRAARMDRRVTIRNGAVVPLP